jgi:hypothetical protein
MPRPTPPPRPLPPITVTNTNDSGLGSLRQALADAHDGDTIGFAAALNGQTVTVTSAELVIDKNITIIGPGPNTVTISGSLSNPPCRIFHVMPGYNVAIKGFTISGGSVGLGEVGGGIWNDHATLAVTNCAVSYNGSAYAGGAIFNDGSNGNAALTIRDSTVSSNSSPFGGGIVSDMGDQGSATLTILNSAVNDNISTNGSPPYDFGSAGGVANSGVAAITNSTINGNSASNSGGGILSTGMLTITNSTISGNLSGGFGQNNWPGSGGGVCNFGTSVIVDSTISGNTASGNDFKGHGLGGAIYTGPIESGYGAVTTVTMQNSTLSDNQANDGGGIYSYQGPDTTSLVEISNTILSAGFSGENIFNDGGTVTSHGYNVSSDDGGGYLNGQGDQINTDPLLGPLQDNGGPTFTHALLAGSPAIDAGDPSFTPPPYYDQRGVRFVRVFSGRIDVGAFETQPQPPPFPIPRARPTPAPRPTPH